MSSDQNSWPGSAMICPSNWMASAGDLASGTILEFDDTRTKPLCVMGHVAHRCFARWRAANQRWAAS